ncbi:MAG TPA: acetyl-CoA C-acyltransferase [Gemmataceae bacterium]|jgi:3-oxoadipyl-CoA thiolase|nr:acetyl-CoA C-acyltransferase [Gemmataceae bacterium]
MRKAVIIDAVRTPIGRYGGALQSCRPDDLAALVIKTLVERTKVDPALIEDVYFGAANQAGEDNRNVARMAALLAGLPDSVAGCTVNRLCASGLEAVNLAARTIEAGMADVIIAGGVESMTRAPQVILKREEGFPRGNSEMVDTTIGWRFTNPKLAAHYYPYSMGETAENVAKKYRIGREAQDRFAWKSQQKTKKAQESGRFSDEIVVVEAPQKKGAPVTVAKDEHPRPETTLENLAKLPPAFAKDGTVTAGNSSGINDGAAAILLVEEETARRLGLIPKALVGPSAAAGVDPACMGIGPVPATQKALKRARLGVGDLDIIEINEAFAVQVLACMQELGLEGANVNPNGGAIALGHPLGCTGARLVTTLVHEMVKTGAKRGLVTLCVGVGQGVATLFEGV